MGGVAVVVPAHDEAGTVAACLRSIARSAAALHRTDPDRVVTVVLVADACTDGTAALAEAEGATVVTVRHRSVGAARRAGVDAALHLLGTAHPDDWIACTDADSVVPVEWLPALVTAAGEGADVVVGTVRPEFADLPAGYAEWWHATHPRGRPNGHVHGANLAIRRSSYRAAGGFSARTGDEDVDLVRRLRLTGARVVHRDDAEVVTSARRSGRAPGGYAAYVALRARLFAAPE